MSTSKCTQIAFIVTAGPQQNDNYKRLPDYFLRAGWQVAVMPHTAVHMHLGEVRLHTHPATSFDLIWPIGFGPKSGFLDRCELLRHLPGGQLITPVERWLSHHGKSVYPQFSPPSVVSARPEDLVDALQAFGGKAVLKPLAGSFGREVTLIDDPEQILTATGDGGGRYWLLQTYVEAIREGEIRSLVCGETLLGSYLRVPADGLHANLALSAAAHPTTLKGNAAKLVADIHRDLVAKGVGFAAIDTVGDLLMEVNVANPGGLATLEALYGEDLGPAVTAATAALVQRRV